MKIFLDCYGNSYIFAVCFFIIAEYTVWSVNDVHQKPAVTDYLHLMCRLSIKIEVRFSVGLYIIDRPHSIQYAVY